MKMSIESGVLGGIIAKVGLAKFLTLGVALLGAAVMAVFRPPQSRKEMAMQAAVALGSSLMFGDLFVSLAHHWLDTPIEDLVVPINGLVGALSWGAFGGLAHYRDKLSNRPIDESIKDVA